MVNKGLGILCIVREDSKEGLIRNEELQNIKHKVVHPFSKFFSTILAYIPTVRFVCCASLVESLVASKL